MAKFQHSGSWLSYEWLQNSYSNKKINRYCSGHNEVNRGFMVKNISGNMLKVTVADKTASQQSWWLVSVSNIFVLIICWVWLPLLCFSTRNISCFRNALQAKTKLLPTKVQLSPHLMQHHHLLWQLILPLPLLHRPKKAKCSIRPQSMGERKVARDQLRHRPLQRVARKREKSLLPW